MKQFITENCCKPDARRTHEGVEVEKYPATEDSPRTDSLPFNFMQRLQEVKMIAMIQMASGLAHEINNPLGAVISNLRTLETYFGKIMTMLETSKELFEHYERSGHRRAAFEEQWRHLDITRIHLDSNNLLSQSLLEAEAISEIIRNFKGVAHENHQDAEPIDVNFEIERVLTVVSSDIPPGARIKRKYGKFPFWHGDPALFCQVVTGILRNAFQSRRQGLHIALKTYRRNDCLVIKIADNGVGIDKKIKPRIFEPFFTTRDIGKGLGLGLATAYDFVHRNQGTLRVTSRLHRGTIVTVVLPYQKATPVRH